MIEIFGRILFGGIFALIYFIILAVTTLIIYFILKKKALIKNTLIIVAVWIIFCMFLPGSITFDPGGYEGPVLGIQLAFIGSLSIIISNLFKKKWITLGLLIALSIYSIALISTGAETCSNWDLGCMAKLGIFFGDTSLCNNHYRCISQIARASPEIVDENICLKVEEKLIGECYHDIAIAKKRINLCDKITGEPEWSTDECKYFVSAGIKDLTFCNNLNETVDKDTCYRTYASENLDASICNKLTYQKEDCVELVNFNKEFKENMEKMRGKDILERIWRILANIIALILIYLILRKA